MNDIEKHLRMARDKISDPDNWSQGAPFSQDGKKICAEIALCDTAPGHPLYSTALESWPAWRLLFKAAIELHPEMKFPTAVVRVNDDLGHEAIMEVYDRAIKEAAELGDE